MANLLAHLGTISDIKTASVKEVTQYLFLIHKFHNLSITRRQHIIITGRLINIFIFVFLFFFFLLFGSLCYWASESTRQRRPSKVSNAGKKSKEVATRRKTKKKIIILASSIYIFLKEKLCKCVLVFKITNFLLLLLCVPRLVFFFIFLFCVLNDNLLDRMNEKEKKQTKI